MKFSIIVSAKDILNNIDRVISNFSNQLLPSQGNESEETSNPQTLLYSENEYEIIIENLLCEEYSADILEKISGFPQFKLLNCDDDKEFIPSAIENSSGKYILFTSDEFSYSKELLSDLELTYVTNSDITSVCMDSVVNHSFEIGNEGSCLEQLQFKSMKTVLGIESSMILNESLKNFDNLVLVDNLSIKRDWLNKVYENYSMDKLSLNIILLKCKEEGILYYNSTIINQFMVTENFDYFSYFKRLGADTVDYYNETKNDIFKLIFPIPLSEKKMTKSFSFTIFGNLYFGSFFMMHIFTLLFVIDIIFFSGLFNSSSPWIFLLFAIVSFLISFFSELHIKNEELDKFEVIKYKYLANFAFFTGVMMKNISYKSVIVPKPVV